MGALSAARSVNAEGMRFGSAAYWPAAAAIGFLALVLVRAGLRRRGQQRATLTGLAAGLCFGISDALTRNTLLIVEHHGVPAVLTTWPAYSLAVAALAAVWLMENSFSAGAAARLAPGDHRGRAGRRHPARRGRLRGRDPHLAADARAAGGRDRRAGRRRDPGRPGARPEQPPGPGPAPRHHQPGGGLSRPTTRHAQPRPSARPRRQASAPGPGIEPGQGIEPGPGIEPGQGGRPGRQLEYPAAAQHPDHPGSERRPSCRRASHQTRSATARSTDHRRLTTHRAASAAPQLADRCSRTGAARLPDRSRSQDSSRPAAAVPATVAATEPAARPAAGRHLVDRQRLHRGPDVPESEHPAGHGQGRRAGGGRGARRPGAPRGTPLLPRARCRPGSGPSPGRRPRARSGR